MELKLSDARTSINREIDGKRFSHSWYVWQVHFWLYTVHAIHQKSKT